MKFKQKLASELKAVESKQGAAPAKYNVCHLAPVTIKLAYLIELVDPKVFYCLLTGFHLIARDKKELDKFSKINTGNRASWPTHTCKVLFLCRRFKVQSDLAKIYKQRRKFFV